MSLRLSRRELLAATGASALLVPLLDHGRARAADPAFPKRIIFVVTGNGTTERAFWPKASGNTLTLGEITSPLEKHKSKLLFTKGVDMKVWAEDNPFGGNGDAHHNFGAILTATKLATGDPPHDPGGPGLALASSISIDQYIGRAFDQQMPVPFPVLSVRAWGRDGTGYATLSWTGDRAPVSAESDPKKLWNTLFAGRTQNAPDTGRIKQQKTRRSVLDYVAHALERQTQHLGKDDQHKLQIHLEAVRSVERQLDASSMPVAACVQPTTPALDFKPIEAFPQLVDTEIDLMTAALACGLTRVVTFAIGDGEDYNIYFPWLGLTGKGIEFPTRHKHDIAHRPGDNDRDKIQTEQWFMSKLAYLLDKLSSVPEGGGTMLDNTIVFWMNAMNSGFSHTVLNLPMIVAGGANTGIRTGGRLLELGSVAHNKVLASLANAVGVPMEGWGDERYKGTLDLS